jgi:hypothetical protein
VAPVCIEYEPYQRKKKKKKEKKKRRKTKAIRQ